LQHERVTAKQKATKKMQNQDPNMVSSLWAGKILNPSTVSTWYPLGKILYTEWSECHSDCMRGTSSICSCRGNCISRFILAGLCAYTQSELWTDRKQQNYTETIEKLTQCLGTTVRSRFFCSTFWEVTSKYPTGKTQLSNLLVCWQGRIVHHLSVTIYKCFDLHFVFYSNWKQKLQTKRRTAGCLFEPGPQQSYTDLCVPLKSMWFHMYCRDCRCIVP
jgi:hypothetical protein